jgi:soluble lytic murein transglycosylase-like protein
MTNARQLTVGLAIAVAAQAYAEGAGAEQFRYVDRSGRSHVIHPTAPLPARAREPAADQPPYAAIIEAAAREHRLPVELVRAVIQVESGFQALAVSPKGAIGLMQLMPKTALALSVDNPFDPVQNIRGGTRYLRQMLDQFGDLSRALAAYNAGPGVVRRHKDVPPIAETRRYVAAVLALYIRATTEKAALESAA